MFLNFSFWLKCESVIHNNASCREKVFSTESAEKSAQINVYKPKQL